VEIPPVTILAKSNITIHITSHTLSVIVTTNKQATSNEATMIDKAGKARVSEDARKALQMTGSLDVAEQDSSTRYRLWLQECQHVDDLVTPDMIEQNTTKGL
jgi:hypothetical protein